VKNVKEPLGAPFRTTFQNHWSTAVKSNYVAIVGLWANSGSDRKDILSIMKNDISLITEKFLISQERNIYSETMKLHSIQDGHVNVSWLKYHCAVGSRELM